MPYTIQSKALHKRIRSGITMINQSPSTAPVANIPNTPSSTITIIQSTPINATSRLRSRRHAMASMAENPSLGYLTQSILLSLQSHEASQTQAKLDTPCYEQLSAIKQSEVDCDGHCPISLKEFDEIDQPTVITSSENRSVFEYAELSQWLSNKLSHPLTREPIKMSQIAKVIQNKHP